ncbi:hypothetical protein J5N97_000566 [Dioscorea zingiberensis]|uniref:1,3-beta-glucan synthase component FKS1-like domain-containing protein n=1 Tax=Dioscorea zingiberensis TaxID=325984 RepID=A0A9D5BSE3_9LILI|nr:hypothetical protein J5N97_000566 [Dioscorea zingiberensis]
MRLNPPPDNIDTLDGAVLRKFRKKLLLNYSNWCSYLGKKSNIWISATTTAAPPPLTSAASSSTSASISPYLGRGRQSLWFVPECLCYIFHNMAMELNKILEDYIDESTGQAAAIIVAWGGEGVSWQALEDRMSRSGCLLCFSTWTGLRFLQSVLDVGMQYSLVSRETMGLGVRMVCKSIAAACWIIVFGVFYGRIWSQRNLDRRWSAGADRRVMQFLWVALVFIIPELLAVAFFILPWILKQFYGELKLAGYFMPYPGGFRAELFVGRGLREGLVDNVKYTLFWILVLSTKFAFSYFMLIKPMIVPSKALVKLDNVEYEWFGTPAHNTYLLDLMQNIPVNLEA